MGKQNKMYLASRENIVSFLVTRLSLKKLYGMMVAQMVEGWEEGRKEEKFICSLLCVSCFSLITVHSIRH